MKLPDLQLRSPQFQIDGDATRQMAAYTAKLEEILLDIYQKLGTVPIVTATPIAAQLQSIGLSSGEFRSDFKILTDSTQTNRRLYYKDVSGTLRYIESD